MCTSVLVGWSWDSSTHSAPLKVNSKLDFRSAAYLWKDPFLTVISACKLGCSMNSAECYRTQAFCSPAANLPCLLGKVIILFFSEKFVRKSSFVELWSYIKHILYCLYLPFNFVISLWLGKSQYLRAQRRSCSVHVSGLIVIPRFILDFSLPWGQTGRKTILNITISFPDVIMLEERYRQLMVVIL